MENLAKSWAFLIQMLAILFVKVLSLMELIILNKKNTFCRFALKIGKAGDWKNHFTPELNQTVDEWIERNLVGTYLQFTTELQFQD